MRSLLSRRLVAIAAGALFCAGAQAAIPATAAEPVASVLAQAERHKTPLLDTLKDLCNIESGSRDLEGLSRLANLIADRFKALGGDVRLIDGNADVYPMEDTPKQLGHEVLATFHGKGTKKILMIAHMDTVYLKGMLAKQPFRIDGNKAFGLGIADDKQGVALILHTVAMLKDLGFADYGTLTVLINSDEEIGSPGSRKLITQLGAEHDVTMSFEGSRVNADKLSLATSGIAGVFLKVQGKASHAGNAPQDGINALYEMAHQVLQMRDLSRPDGSVKMNWTVAKAGSNRNVIPDSAEAAADVRVLRVEDYDALEKTVRERAARQLVPGAKVSVVFERRRPPLEASAASRTLAAQAQAVYRELGRELVIDPVAEGGGTDAAFAAQQTKNAVIERFGLQGYGAHSTNDEYVLVDSIVPRLYLGTRLVMEVSRGAVK
ncbi:M20/M25/M40 family metallo-hydrolase [Noviherbaspirillum sp. DKR-6]|uniref:M20/M25/M40 family metallo-hydrolase n=2 Tax=Noviherbaspirillum pedocola TaxID=2801341 RepID=A0A934W9G7_9BURK|nr:M20/M25/M40 family metallo-hydrolase [Noviherbaspirillum pedocola]MBK4738880.1 M20/M25/M40 family metallo-hydrolase [Noviherbaspirillum pedocola]